LFYRLIAKLFVMDIMSDSTKNKRNLLLFCELFSEQNKNQKIYNKLTKGDLMDIMQMMVADQSFSKEVRAKVVLVIEAFEQVKVREGKHN